MARLLRSFDNVPPTSPQPVVLAAVLDPWLPRVLADAGYGVHTATSGAETHRLVLRERPDVVVLGPLLEDMSGAEACRLIRTDPAASRQLPILILLDSVPTPELRVAAIRVGAWDFLSPSAGASEVLLKIATYVEARRTFSEAADAGVLDPASGFCNRPGLARRAREVFSLMARVRAPFACIVIEVGDAARIPDLGSIVARAARVSDVVGDLGASRMGIIAPATDARGAVDLAVRVEAAVGQTIITRGLPAMPELGAVISAGYDVVPNAKYAPVDPYTILQRAALALDHGESEPSHPWVRKYVDLLLPSRIVPVGANPIPSLPPSDRSGGLN